MSLPLTQWGIGGGGRLGSSELFPRVLVRVYVCVVVISRTAPLSTDNSLPQANLNEQV